jgi:hypothetical protein
MHSPQPALLLQLCCSSSAAAALLQQLCCSSAWPDHKQEGSWWPSRALVPPPSRATCLQGIGCNVLAYDIVPAQSVLDMGIPYVPLAELLPQCDILTLHCPLLPTTRYMIDRCAAAPSAQLRCRRCRTSAKARVLPHTACRFTAELGAAGEAAARSRRRAVYML